MSAMNFHMLLLSSLLILASCGERSKNDELDYFRVPQKHKNSISLLTKESADCKNSSNPEIKKSHQLQLFLNGSYVTENYDFSSMIEGRTLRASPAISKAVYKEKLDIINSRAYTIAKPQEIIFCSGDEEYAEDSIEAAALSAAYFIHKTYEKFRSLFPEIPVSPITLNVSAEITDSVLVRNSDGDIIKESTFRSDNAYYQPFHQSIYILPHSEGYLRYGNPKYWQVPSVASHEYGHHLFQSIFPGHINKAAVLSTTYAKERKVTKQLVLDALNEGFSDLIAHYSLSEDERSVRGVVCLQNDRDVNSSFFGIGLPKNFSKEVLEKFFSPTKADEQVYCYIPSFQSVHVMGAIFAHHANELFAHVTTSEDERLKLLVEWVKSIKDLDSALTPEEYFEAALKKLVSMVMNRTHPQDSVLCSKVEAMIPDVRFPECNDL